jgi:transposase InsO family protein
MNGFAAMEVEVLGEPEHVRSDSGPQLVSSADRLRLGARGVDTSFTETGVPGRKAHIESFNGGSRNEQSDREPFNR